MRFLLPWRHLSLLLVFCLWDEPESAAGSLSINWKPALISVEQLHESEKTLTLKITMGKVWLLNVWLHGVSLAVRNTGIG